MHVRLDGTVLVGRRPRPIPEVRRRVLDIQRLHRHLPEPRQGHRGARVQVGCAVSHIPGLPLQNLHGHNQRPKLFQV